jgi:hypothetical protein
MMTTIGDCLSAAVLAFLLGVITLPIPAEALVGPCATCRAAPGPLVGAAFRFLSSPVEHFGL